MSQTPNIRPLSSASPSSPLGQPSPAGLPINKPEPKLPNHATASTGSGEVQANKIKAFGNAMGAGHHQESWKRPTNVTGAGATHMKSFNCRLAQESVELMDKQINEWLDSHPDYEVKFVTTSVGDWTGKLKEPHLIVQLWV